MLPALVKVALGTATGWFAAAVFVALVEGWHDGCDV